MKSCRICILTLGCKVNQYESHNLLNYLENKDFISVGIDDSADIVVINTCAVTMQATRKSRQIIRQARRNNPHALVIILGCLAQIQDTIDLLKDDVDVFLGSEHKSKVIDIINNWLSGQPLEGKDELITDFSGEAEYDEMPGFSMGERVRAEVKVQDGCEQYCTYCLIPFMRGPERSRKPENAIEEIKYLIANGYHEIVLTGIHLGAYGKDLPDRSSLTDLVRLILSETSLKRLRMSSVEPTDITDELINLIANNNRIAPHLHIPLQGGNDRLLRTMNRKYTTANFQNLVSRIRSRLPDIAITTDLIVGFPGETECDFIESMSFVKKVQFSGMHIFRYSPRPGTKAARMKEQVSGVIAKARSEKMHLIAETMKESYHNSMIGKTYSVLIEKCNKNLQCEGHAENYVKVHVNDANLEKNSLIKVQIIESNTYCVLGNML